MGDLVERMQGLLGEAAKVPTWNTKDLADVRERVVRQIDSVRNLLTNIEADVESNRFMYAIELLDSLEERGHWLRKALVKAEEARFALTRTEAKMGEEEPLDREEEKQLARANVFMMDVEMDGGTLPPAIDKLNSKKGKLSPSESRQVLRWFDATAPGNF